ncbi:LacI family DNA-binding transcriptional regulator [Paenibacillus ihbetae]|uniref:LacI family transcriptional regulator n=1 Tax=Paenibacillus ihbetae TaxID=1870820 RepID=A0A1B2E648_9BACL|nr:LacI family DNA-binding transcriptional regulator [Paenibacillus ihbetae]ANY75455.1 LacI family transcriptional regulator [Paenibacillus ihbetae]OOC62373.1 LacI family transcriptional regulator [Paenibacillus ihbetae]
MAKEKVTIQDIADALGISRNTASKALNGSATIPDETRNKVIKKAIELKYKQFAYMESDSLISKQPGNIALLTANMPSNSHFGSRLISGLEKRISDEGYNLSIHIVRDIDRSSLMLPNNFEASKVDGIICIELFDLEYSKKITSLGVPTIFIDCAADLFYPDLEADLLLMENEHSTYRLTKQLIDKGCRTLGFIGDYHHCKSFHERWAGFTRALNEKGIPLDLDQCVLNPDREFFSDADWMDKRLGEMKQLPSGFVCANDFIAVNVMKALKNKDLHIPEDIVVTGFDNANESRIVEPHLTTVHIYSNEMGITAANMLLSRIKEPSQPYQVTHIQTKPILRESTGD